MKKEKKVPRLAHGEVHPPFVYFMMVKSIYENSSSSEVFRQQCKAVVSRMPPSRAGTETPAPNPALRNNLLSYSCRYLVNNFMGLDRRRLSIPASQGFPTFTAACKGRDCKGTRGKAQRNKVMTLSAHCFLDERLENNGKWGAVVQTHQELVM